jgi:predicted transcriptional regulator
MDQQTALRSELASATGIETITYLCVNPNRSVSAGRLAEYIDRDERRVLGALEALVDRGIAQREVVSRGAQLYRLSPTPVVWNLANAHRAHAA